MTDISIKNRIIALISFAFAAIVLSVCSVSSFSLVFFACIGVVLFFADKLLNSEKIKERTAFAFFVFAICYQTFFQGFYRIHEPNLQLMSAAGFALLLAAVFALTDDKKIAYPILIAPILCFLEVKTASAYCFLLLSFSIVKLMLNGNSGKNIKKKKSSKKKKEDSKDSKLSLKTLIIISIVTSVVCFAFCIYSIFKNNINPGTNVENLQYLFRQFKNTIGFIIFIVYFLVKLIKSELRVTAGIFIGVILNISGAVFFTVYYGWTSFSLSVISTVMFLGLICLESENVTNAIKEDYQKHKYIFLLGLLCMLQ